MEKLVYKYNGETQIIRFNSAEKFNEYLVKNINEIELIEDVEVIDLCAPVEVEEAPVEPPKTEVIVKTFIEEFEFLKEDRKDVLEELTDWLMANVVDDELFIEYCLSRAVTTISDNELAKSILKDRGCILETPITKEQILVYLEDGEEEYVQTIQQFILSRLEEEEVEDLAFEYDLRVINCTDDAVNFLQDEGYICLHRHNDLKFNIQQLLSDD